MVFSQDTILGSFSINALLAVRFKIHALIFKRDLLLSHSKLTAIVHYWLDMYLGYAQSEFRPGQRVICFYCLTQQLQPNYGVVPQIRTCLCQMIMPCHPLIVTDTYDNYERTNMCIVK